MNGEYIEGRPCRLDFSTPRDNTNNNNNNRRGGFGGGFGGRERSATQDPVTAPQDQISQLNSKVLRRPLIKPSV